VHVLLRNIGSADLNLPIGVDAENLLATGTGREYLTVKIEDADPPEPRTDFREFAFAKLAMNAEHPESGVTLHPGDTVTIDLSLGEKPRGAGKAPLTAVVSLRRITTGGANSRDEQIGSDVRPLWPIYWL
jgi:hypothetical protein